jgi:hypothetical protein
VAVTTQVFSIGTAGTKIVTDSGDMQDVIIQNIEPEANADDLAREGYLYLVGQKFTVGASGTVIFNMATPPGGLQLEFYEIVSTAEAVLAELIEGGTVTTTGNAIPSYNINRTEPDDAATVFKAATAVTDGSVVSTELITGSKQGGGGATAFSKIHTLNGGEDYAMRFTNQTNQQTICFLQLGFSEKFNGQSEVWVGEGLNDGVRLRGGDRIQMRLQQGQTLWAISPESAQLAVLRQD